MKFDVWFKRSMVAILDNKNAIAIFKKNYLTEIVKDRIVIVFDVYGSSSAEATGQEKNLFLRALRAVNAEMENSFVTTTFVIVSIDCPTTCAFNHI